MATLTSFTGSILPGDVSISEGNVRVCSLPMKYMTNIAKISSYPEINISKELFNSHISRQDHLILPVQEPLLKKFSRVLFEEGIKNSLEVLESSESTILCSISRGILKMINYGQRVKIFFNPHLKEIGIDNYEKFSQVRNWKNAPIRCISFHPQCFKIAVAGVDDSIRIYLNDEDSVVTMLKNSQQKSIFSLAWRPYSCCLAVGCQSGFLIWTIDVSRTLSQATHFRHENHFPVTSLEFNHNGNLLATASMSITDSSILIWDVDKNSCVQLQRFSVPFLNLQWSLNGAFLFTSTVGKIFRVWNCEKWTSDRWTIANGHVQSFQWSPCTRFLLFVTSEESVLYSLGFADESLFNQSSQEVQQPQRALPVADLSKITIDHNEAGGIPQQIAWNGKYLAISFKDSNSIAIFQTSIRQHRLHILPMFFLCGIGAEFPTSITFKPSYKDNTNIENVLTIGWSSGRVQFSPFV